jgi:DNA-binding transcriptional regulator YiaG
MSEILARQLQAAREKLGLSQPQAAKKWGIPLPTLRHWEQNQRTPRGFALEALTAKLDAILKDPPAPSPKKRAKKAPGK